MEKLKVLNRNSLKYLAIIAMTMDHSASLIFETNSIGWTIFRFFGRLTFPLMIFFMVDGFRYTRNLKKYILRLFAVSIIGIFTFSFFETGSFLPIQVLSGVPKDYPYNYYYIASIDKTLYISLASVFTNLLLALLTLTVWEKTNWNDFIKVIVTIFLLILSMWCDWNYFSIAFVLIFYYLRDNKTAKWCLYSLLSLLYIFNVFLPSNQLDISQFFTLTFKPFKLGMILFPIAIEFFYNGEAGKKSSFNKWFFYVYYPLHQVILGFIALLIK